MMMTPAVVPKGSRGRGDLLLCLIRWLAAVRSLYERKPTSVSQFLPCVMYTHFREVVIFVLISCLTLFDVTVSLPCSCAACGALGCNAANETCTEKCSCRPVSS